MRPWRLGADGHLSAARIRSASLRSTPGKAVVDPSMERLALHLALGCPTCWRAAEQARPHPRDPVATGLVRLARPDSWLALGDDHLAAMRTVRQRPFGFAYVVVEECWLPDVGVHRPADVPWLRRFVDGLARAAPGRPEIADLAVLACCRQGELLLSRRAWRRAAGWLGEARARLPATTGDPRVHVRALELEASLRLGVGEVGTAEKLLVEAAGRAGPEHARHRFRLYWMAAAIPHLPPARRVAHFDLALAEIDRLRHAGDPVDRLLGVHRRAQAMVVLLTVAPTIPWPGYAETLSQLEDTDRLYGEHADARVHAEALVHRARLLKVADPASALPVYLRALEGWTAAGDAVSFADTFAETVLAQKVAGHEDHDALTRLIDAFSARHGHEVLRDRLWQVTDMLRDVIT